MARIERMTVVEQIGRNPANRGRELAVRARDPRSGYIAKAASLFSLPVQTRRVIELSQVEVRTPLGILMDPSVIFSEPKDIDVLAATLDRLFEVANARKTKALQAQAPASALNLDLLVASRAKVRVMRGEVQVSMWDQFVQETGYQPQGHNKVELKKKNGGVGGDRGFLNEDDCQAFIKWAREKTGDQTLRLPTDAEYLAIKEELSEQLTGTLWDRLDDNAFRSLRYEIRNSSYPENRYNNNGLRLVGDLLKS